MTEDDFHDFSAAGWAYPYPLPLGVFPLLISETFPCILPLSVERPVTEAITQ